MDGWPLAASRGASSLIGILYAEDFDEPATDDFAAEPAAEPAELPPPPLTQADLDQACLAAVAAARREWETDAQQTSVDILGAVGRALTDARQAAEQVALATADALVKTMLTMLSGALPQFCREHGAGEVHALLVHLLPTLRSEPRVVVGVHSDLVAELRRQLLDLPGARDGTLVVLSASVERGDVRIEWENGALARNTRQILQAMQDALSQLGLQQSENPTPEGNIAHAE